MTDEGRKRRLRAALKAHEDEPEPKESAPVAWRGAIELFPVVKLEVDVPLLNVRSHRLRAKLEGHPEGHLVADAPWTDEAQAVVTKVLKERHRNFERLKDSLRLEGQRDPGVITRSGILINANSRAVALRELDDPEKRWIRVAVLPEDASPQELAELELQLQVQDPLKDDYALTEELLFIEEMFREFHKSPRQIALDLRWATDDGRSLRAGEEKVNTRRRILALIREMQKMTRPPLPLTFFDDRLEALRALEATYSSLSAEDPARARRYRESWLAASLAGAGSVHDLRGVDEDFISFMRDRLEETRELGARADELLERQQPKAVKAKPPGVELLDAGVEGDVAAAEDGSEGDLGQLLDLLATSLTKSTPTITLPRSGERIDRETFATEVKQATKGAIRDRKAVDKAAYRAVRNAEQFDRRHRGQFSQQLRKAKQLVAELGTLEAE